MHTLTDGADFHPVQCKRLLGGLLLLDACTPSMIGGLHVVTTIKPLFIALKPFLKFFFKHITSFMGVSDQRFALAVYGTMKFVYKTRRLPYIRCTLC